MSKEYTGRFAPSPTGLLHAGSLVAALASWLDARAHGGRWLVRMEDVDTPRCVAGAGQAILRQLAACGLLSDAPVVWQSARGAAYGRALDALARRALAYPCRCTRSAIAAAQAARGVRAVRGAALPYPGTCRPPQAGARALPMPQACDAAQACEAAHAWRLNVHACTQNMPPARAGQQTPLRFLKHGDCLHWHDRRLGAQSQDVAAEVGDFVLRRADGVWAYQLAVVVDDAAQGVTHIVRGQDLADNTPRQMLLQAALGLPTPAYLHTPLVLAADGQKLSKQNAAQPLVLDSAAQALDALNAAAQTLGLPLADAACTQPDALALWVRAWPWVHQKT